MSRTLSWRRAILSAASLVFLWLCAEGDSLWPLAVFAIAGFGCLKTIDRFGAKVRGPAITAILLVYIWLKKYTFLPHHLFITALYTTIGISYMLFRIISLMADDGAGDGIGVLSYLAYLLNFTTLVAGPIQPYRDFDRSMRNPEPLTAELVGNAVQRIITGFFKVNVLGLTFSTIQSYALAALADPTASGAISEAAIAVAVYPLFLYCNFSGYIDIVIGVAGFLGIALPENFNRPFSADSFIGFWDRWHITLSEWLKRHVYTPLLMTLIRRYPSERLAPWLAIGSYFVTFFLIGAWHGRTSAFLFFGFLQGLGVSGNKVWQLLLTARLGKRGVRELNSSFVYRSVCRGLTFTWFTFTLIWFWSNWQEMGLIARSLGLAGCAAILSAIFAASALLLAGWEKIYAAVSEGNASPRRSRYVKVAYCTAALLVSIAVLLTLQQHGPEIAYKAF